jgi:hypothetical protein
MLILSKIIAILIVAAGCIFLVKPMTLKQYMAFCREGNRIYLMGTARILFGIIFLLAASACRLPGVVLTFGILGLIGGIIIFSVSLEKSKSMISWWRERSFIILRLISVLAILAGGLLLYSI